MQDELSNRIQTLEIHLDDIRKQLIDIEKNNLANIRTEIDREVDRLKSAVGTGWKLLVVAVGVVGIAIAFFSVKTAIDVDKGIAAAAEKEVSQHVALNGPNSPLRRVLSTTLLDAYLIRLARQTSIVPGIRNTQVLLDDASADELLAMLKNPDTSDEDFTALLQVLSKTKNPTNWSRVVRAMTDFVKGTDEYNWTNGQPSRKAAALRQLTKMSRLATTTELLSISKNILQTDSDPSLSVAALAFISTHGDRDSVRILETKFSSTDRPQIKSAILVSLAKLQPDNPIFIKYIDNLADANNAKTAGDILKIAIDVMDPTPTSQERPFSSDEDPYKNIRPKLCSKLLLALVGHSYHLSFVIDDETSLGGIELHTKGFGISEPTFNRLLLDDKVDKVINDLIISSLKDHQEQFPMLISLFTIDKPAEQYNEDQSPFKAARIQLILKPGAKLLCDGKIAFDNSSAPEGVFLEPDNKGKVIVIYKDYQGIEKRAEFLRLENPQQVTSKFIVRSSVYSSLSSDGKDEGDGLDVFEQ